MAAGDSLGRQFHYQPDPSAPAEGEFTFDEHHIATGYRQKHEHLVQDAIHSWGGWPTDIRRELGREKEGAPLDLGGSGTQKIWRAQAGALNHELQTNAQSNPTALYRGSHEEPKGVNSWSESRAVANHWARKGSGQVFVARKGTVKGLRRQDYTGVGPANEKEWLVEH